MTTFDSVAIVGLGLIGGSVARDLAALGTTIHAYDADATQLAAAVRDGIVKAPMDASLDGVRGADIVIIAVPVDAAVDVLGRIAGLARDDALIMDVGSTKARIVEAASQLGLGDRFVGAHPLAGDHRSGWEASRTRLFVDAAVYLCPPREAGSDLIARAADFWQCLGGRPECMSATPHDLRLAWTSHLPHMVSMSLALALERAGVRRELLGPGGRDTTRLAGSSPELWTAISLENAAAISAALERTEQELAALRVAIERGDATTLRARLSEARDWAGRGKGEAGTTNGETPGTAGNGGNGAAV